MEDKKQILNTKNLFPIGVYFLLTDTCNLKCEYCFANTIRAVNSLDLTVAKKAIDSLFINATLRKCKTVLIKFSGGGEPTIQFETMREIVEYAKGISNRTGIDIDLHLATNGQWENDQITNWINENVNALLISIDGAKKTQNFQRPRIDGRDSFTLIAKNLKKINKNNKTLTARLTISDKSVDLMLPNLKKMYKLGFNKVQIEPLLIMNNSKDKLSSPDKDKFVKNYIKCVRYAYKKCKSIYSSLDVFNNSPSDKYFCSHQVGDVITVTPEGKITSCPEKCDKNNPVYKKFYLGYIDKTVIYDNDENLIYQNDNILPQECMKCICCNYCKGGCISKRDFYNDEYLCYITRQIYSKHYRLIKNSRGNKL